MSVVDKSSVTPGSACGVELCFDLGDPKFISAIALLGSRGRAAQASVNTVCCEEENNH